MNDKLNDMEEQFDKAKLALNKKLDLLGPIEVLPYLGYGRTDYVYCRGRVLVDKGITTQANDSYWQNLKNTIRRFESDEIPSATISFNYGNNLFSITSNDEGYFIVDKTLNTPLINTSSLWHKAEVNLTKSPIELKKEVKNIAEILVPLADADFGVISDLDDTVIETEVTSKIKMLYNSFLKNAYTRSAFKGVNAFYWALHKGKNGYNKNPIFYVSNSPWNLYDMLVDFLKINNIPKGPILLRDFGLQGKADILTYKGHKYYEILKILRTYPNLSFILIGDSGEKDANTYLEIARAFPHRILAIYIRSVQEGKRAQRVLDLAETEDNVDLLLIENSLDAAKHALSKGFISVQSWHKVQQSMYNKNNDVALDEWTDEEEE